MLLRFLNFGRTFELIIAALVEGASDPNKWGIWGVSEALIN